METRKVQQVSGGTYTVSLPKEWAESEGIGAGTEVTLHTHRDGLVVVEARERDGVDGPVAVRATGEESAPLERLLRAAYAAGREAVRIEAADAFTREQRRTVEAVARDLTGATVTENGPSRIRVGIHLDPAEVSLRQSVRQLLFVAESLHSDATAALRGDAAVPDPGARDDQADRLFAMTDRYVGRGLARLDEADALGLDRATLFELRVTARELERMADHAERIAAVAAATDGECVYAPDDWQAVAGSARAVVRDAVEVVVDDRDLDAAWAALEARDAVRTALADLERRLFDERDSDHRLVRALDALARTADCGGNVAELAIRAAIRRGDLDGVVPAAGDAGDAAVNDESGDGERTAGDAVDDSPSSADADG